MNAPAPRVSPLTGIARSALTAHQNMRLEDRSLAPRFGCKGRGAADWLAAAGLPLPARPNSWLALEGGGLIARLGVTEYLVEGAPALIDHLRARPRALGVYPVLREDAAFRLSGPAVADVLRQSCNVNFAALPLAEAPVVLTSMVGVGVTAIPLESELLIWCDYTWGAYLVETLLDIAAETAC